MERIPPAQYLQATYYEHWLHAFEEYLARDDAGFAAELERRTQIYLDDPDTPLPATVNHDLAGIVAGMARSGAPTRREVAGGPRFAAGDRVLVDPSVPVGHTRKAGYVRGATGTVLRHHGGFVYPDINGNTAEEAPKHVYTVGFSSTDLFGKDYGHAGVFHTIDLWEPHLSLVPETTARS